MSEPHPAFGGEGATLAKTLRQARHAVMRTSPGDFFGAEEHLARSYEVSRPTMRQVPVLLCQEGVLEVRRGLRGGYYAKHPDATAITHNALIYLRTQGAGVSEVVRAVEPIRSDMAALAAENRDPRQLKRWEEFLEADAERKRVGSFRDFKESDIAFESILRDACGNRVLALLMETLHPLGEIDDASERILGGEEERLHIYWEHRNRAILSIMAGDAFASGVHMRRGLQRLTQWLQEDLAQGRGFGPPRMSTLD